MEDVRALAEDVARLEILAGWLAWQIARELSRTTSMPGQRYAQAA
jgi:hypothetical protein